MKRLLAGCGIYLQGEDVLEQVVPALLAEGHRSILAIAGRQAFAAVRSRLGAALGELNDFSVPLLFNGHCTDGEIEQYAGQAKARRADCVLGIGGGKVLDLAKAAAAEAGLPVFCLPTSAATCAAFAPLSVVYHPEGSQKEIRFFSKEVAGVFVDTRVIAAAPPRLLAAGLADAMAKACEYASMLPEVACGTLPFGKYMGYRLALVGDEAITAGARLAMDSVRKQEVTDALENMIFCAIACTGIVSGLGGFGGRGGARFAIAHAFNEVLRGAAFPPETWLHGEVVAVGILAQMAANGDSASLIAERRVLFEDLGIPCTLSRLSPDLRGNGLEAFTRKVLACIEATPAQQAVVRAAIHSVA